MADGQATRRGCQAPVAQRIRASHCGCEGQRFESSRAYQRKPAGHLGALPVSLAREARTSATRPSSERPDHVNSGSCWRTIQPLQQPSSRAACSQTPRGENLCNEAEFTAAKPRELGKLLEDRPTAPAAVLSGIPAYPRGENLCHRGRACDRLSHSKPVKLLRSTKSLGRRRRQAAQRAAAVLSGRPLRGLRNPRTSATRPSSQPPSHVNS